MCWGLFAPGLLPDVHSTLQVNISGDMYIATAASVYLKGLVLVDTVPAGNARLINYGSLTFDDSLMLASRHRKFGIFRNNGTLSFSKSAAGTVSVLMYFLTGDQKKYHSFSFLFDVAISSIKGLNEPQTFDTHYYLMTYDGKQRATIGLNNTNWRWLGNDGISLTSHPNLNTGEAYFIYPERAMSLVFPVIAPTITPAPSPTFFNKTTRSINVAIHTGPTRPTQFGWNFIGNLQTDSFTLKQSTTSYRGFAYYHDGNGTFKTKDLSSVVDELIQIPFSDNAFVMQAYSFPAYQTGSFPTTFSADGSPLRSAISGVPSDDVLELTLSSVQSPYTDMLRIQRDDCYSDDFMLGEDAPKMFSFPSSGKAEFYTVLGENKLVFDKRRQISGDIPLGIDLKGDDTYTISINKQTGYDAKTILLVEYSSGVEKLHNLSASPYVFQSGISQSENHYALRIAQLTTGIEQEQKSETEIVVYSLNRQLYVKNLRKDDAVWVYDASGQLLSGGQSDAGEFSCTLPQAGIYILKVSGARAYTTKIAVKF
jgi:hypothetical protein